MGNERGLSGAGHARPATLADLDAVVETLTLAFADDPVWRPTLTRLDGTAEEMMRPFWQLWVRGALRYPWTWVMDDAAAVSVWIPPGGTELSEEQEGEFLELAFERLGEQGREHLIQVLDRFAGAHPHDEQHYYLNLLGTHPAHRGQGLGMALLRENLARIDAIGVPTYLESSNPANDGRYRGVGFRPVVEFQLPNRGPTVTGMWRPAGGAESTAVR